MIVKTKPLGNGQTRMEGELDSHEVNRCVTKVVGFMQPLCHSNPLLALAVAQATCDALKRLFNVTSEVVLSEHPLQ